MSHCLTHRPAAASQPEAAVKGSGIFELSDHENGRGTPKVGRGAEAFGKILILKCLVYISRDYEYISRNKGGRGGAGG